MDDNAWSAITVGAIIGFLIGIVIGVIIFGNMSKPVYACVNAGQAGATMTWIKDEPFCLVHVNLNGEDRTITAENYVDMMEK